MFTNYYYAWQGRIHAVFGKGPGFAEPWLSTKTGGGGGGGGGNGGGGGVEIQELRSDSPPILILCFVTVQICSTPLVRYSNLGNMSLMRAVCI